jgi:hypothetical protein
MRFAPLAPVSLLLLVACGASPPAAPPVTPGAGLLSFDAEPPAGAATWARPTWRIGDRFVLQRGAAMKGEFKLIAITEGAYVLDTGGGVHLRRDLDLGNLGEWTPAGVAQHLLLPVDVRFHWPLWLGKRWSCEFVDRAKGGELRLQASYHVEGLDTVTVPAGTFEALRIVRRVQLVGTPDDYLTRAQLLWYAPSIGSEVRQLVAETLVELVEFTPGVAP